MRENYTARSLVCMISSASASAFASSAVGNHIFTLLSIPLYREGQVNSWEFAYELAYLVARRG